MIDKKGLVYKGGLEEWATGGSESLKTGYRERMIRGTRRRLNMHVIINIKWFLTRGFEYFASRNRKWGRWGSMEANGNEYANKDSLQEQWAPFLPVSGKRVGL